MDRLEELAGRIGGEGWGVVPDFLDQRLVKALRKECLQLAERGALRPAAIGSGTQRQTRGEIRADEILWLDRTGSSAAQGRCLARFEELRLTLNRVLQLGLFTFECHFARYAPGAFYLKHLDQFRDDARRRLSCVLYLNQTWQAEDGGELRLYLDRTPDAKYLDLYPEGGTLVAFLSERFPHEVRPAKRERWSLSGWFRARD